MANIQEPPILAAEDASVTSLVLGNAHLMFDCGVGGNILAAKGIDFSRLKLPDVNQGKIIKVSSRSGSIVVEHIGADAKHTTLIGLDKKNKTQNELHIRIPIGVRFFEVDVPDDAPAGYDAKAFFFQTGDGYNIIPHFLPITPQIDPQQRVQELILITSHVPPRSGPISAADTERIPRLDPSELEAVQKPDVRPVKRPKRGA